MDEMSAVLARVMLKNRVTMRLKLNAACGLDLERTHGSRLCSGSKKSVLNALLAVSHWLTPWVNPIFFGGCMNIMPMAASFIRTTAQRVTDGAFPPSDHLDEWAIYQRDLETARLMAQTAPIETAKSSSAASSTGEVCPKPRTRASRQ
jgi:hypothetical protein